MVAVQLLERTLDDYQDPSQSESTPGYGMERALVALWDDLWHGQDSGCMTILALFDLSAAFNIINPCAWINSEDLCWVVSFSRVNPSQWQLGKRDSAPDQTVWGAAGIRLSPFLFNIYMKPLGEIICCHELRHYHYADDTHLYISSPGKLSDVVDILSQHLETMKFWMGNNRLQLARIALVLRPSGSRTIHLWYWLELHCQIDPVHNLETPARLAGDSHREGAFAQLHIVCQLCLILDQRALLMVSFALVTFCLDYFNVFYLGLPLKSIRKRQLLQNAAV